MPRIYLAANYSRAPEMRMYRQMLQGYGYQVVCRWIDRQAAEAPVSMGPEDLARQPSLAVEFATSDLHDIIVSDMVLFFSTGTDRSKGGRHTEMGIALALNKSISLIGPMENVFHALPSISRFPDWDAFYSVLKEANSATSSSPPRSAAAATPEYAAEEGSPAVHGGYPG
jgi:hypothetical protein